jgi:hypothetical protein
VTASRYRIVLRGRLSDRFASAFDGMTLELGPGQTVLAGEVRDQAHLYGLLDRLRDFGIELLAVEPAETQPPQSARLTGSDHRYASCMPPRPADRPESPRGQ